MTELEKGRGSGSPVFELPEGPGYWDGFSV